MNRYILSKPISIFYKPEGDATGSSGDGDHIHEQEGDKKVHVSNDEGFAKFRERFTVKNNASVDKGGDPKNPPTAEQIDQARKDTERLAAERQADKEKNERIGKQVEEKKRAGGNIDRILESKRSAEKERDEYKARLEKYEKEEKPAIEGKIAELQSRIDSGELSASKEKEYTEKIAGLEAKMNEREESLVNENSTLRKRLAFYNLAEDDDFKREYVEPVAQAYTDAVEVLTQDRQKAALRNALAINRQILQTTDPSEIQKLTQERDEHLNAITDDLKGFSSTKFTEAITRYITHSKKHAQALQDHEATTSNLRQEAQKRADKAKAERIATWRKTYENTATEYKVELTAEEKKLAKELNLDPDSELSEADQIASKTVMGKSSMTEAIDIIHRGRVYPALKAKIAIMDKQLKDRDAIIAKLRGASTGDGDVSGNAGEGSGQKKNEKPSREDFHKRFSANRFS